MDIPRMIACGLLFAVGCGMSAAGPDAPGGGDFPGHTPGMPGLGAHGLSYYRYRVNSPSSIATPAMTTQPSGSTIVVGVGRGDNTKFVIPTDDKGNAPYAEQGQMHPYIPYYPNSGTAVYAFTSAKGGGAFKVSNTTDPADEITLAAVEVIEGSRIQAVAWTEPTGPPLTSKTVTTTGPATLVAFWWGDATATVDQTAIPDNGFTVVDSILAAGSLVQCAVAVKNVTAAGTYDVTWTATPEQGAQLWLIAVQ
jgi:hypothetical protein